jgi:transposase
MLGGLLRREYQKDPKHHIKAHEHWQGFLILVKPSGVPQSAEQEIDPSEIKQAYQDQNHLQSALTLHTVLHFGKANTYGLLDRNHGDPEVQPHEAEIQGRRSNRRCKTGNLEVNCRNQGDYTHDSSLARHLVDKVPVSELCEELGLRPTVFYRWQKELFENGAAPFQSQERPHRQVEEKQKRIEFLEKKVQTKNEVLAELMAEHIALKKSLGEL